MTNPIRFYFDFASPYAYFALDGIESLAAEYGRAVEWRPILMWAVLKAHNIAPPMDSNAKRAYLLHDMTRSAAFHGLPYRAPAKLPLSSHFAARLYHVLASRDEAAARALGKSIFDAFFVAQEDISTEGVLIPLAARHGMPADDARGAISGQQGRALLETAVTQAIADNVCGSPYFILDGEGFFGADRLAQLRWRLSAEGQAAKRHAIREEAGG